MVPIDGMGTRVSGASASYRCTFWFHWQLDQLCISGPERPSLPRGGTRDSVQRVVQIRAAGSEPVGHS